MHTHEGKWFVVMDGFMCARKSIGIGVLMPLFMLNFEVKLGELHSVSGQRGVAILTTV